MLADIDWKFIAGGVFLLIAACLALWGSQNRRQAPVMASEPQSSDEQPVQEEESLPPAALPLPQVEVDQPPVQPGDQISAVYQCVPVEESEGRESNFSGRIFLPQSLLTTIMDPINHQDMPPMQFSIESTKTGRRTHCSVQEFTSIEGSAYLPNWIMRQLQLQRDDQVTITMTRLVNGTRAKFRINTTFSSFQNDPVAVLEQHLRRYSCLTLGDQLEIELAGIVYTLTVTSLEPAEAVSIINIDLTIDIEWDDPEQAQLTDRQLTEPDFDWQPGFLKFSRRGKRPATQDEGPHKAKVSKFPGEGNRLGGSGAEVADSNQPDGEITNEPSDDQNSA